MNTKIETPVAEVLRLVNENCSPNGMGIHLIKKWLEDALVKEKNLIHKQEDLQEEYKSAVNEIKDLQRELKTADSEIRELQLELENKNW